MAETTTPTETEEDRLKRLSLSDVRSGFGLIGDIFGTLFNWGVPALIFGGIFLAAAGPISQILPQEWRQPFLDFVDGIKLKINETIGKDIFNVPDERKVALAESNPERVEQALATAIGSPELAHAIVPDSPAAGNLARFLSEQKILSQPERLLEPQNLAAFVRRNPATMQRIVNALPAGTGAGAAQIPAALKAPLKTLLSDASTLQTLLADPQHAQWINTAVTKLGGPQATALFPVLSQDPASLANVLGQVIDGASAESIFTGLQQHAATSPEQQRALAEIAYDAMKQDAAYGPLLAALEKADPKVADELKAITDASQLPQQALAIITATPQRIAALKELSPEQLVAVLGKANITLEGDAAILLGHKETREAAIDMLGKLGATNTAGQNELGTMLTSLSQQTTLAGRAGVIAAYAQGNTERLGALYDFKLAAERIAATRGDDAKPAYATVAAGLGLLVGNAPQAAQLAQAAEKLPDNLKPVIDGVVTNGAAYLSQLMFDDRSRAYLNSETDGRKNLYHVGDALAAMDASKFAGGAAALAMLTTKRGDAYPNLDALVQAAATIDAHSGSNVAAAEGLALKPEAERTDADKALLKAENETDENTQRIIGVMAATAQGKLTRVGEEKGVDTVYRAETFMGPVDVSGTTLAAYFNNGQHQSVTAITQLLNTLDTSTMDANTRTAFTALKDHFWVDANHNGSIDAGEGAARMLYDPAMAEKLLATAASGENQFNGAFVAGASALLSGVTLGWAGNSNQWHDGAHLAAIADAMGKAGVGAAQQPADLTPEPLRLAMAGTPPAGMSPVLSK